MPPKTSTSKTSKANKSDKEAVDAINQYLSQKPDFDKLIKDAKESSGRSFPETRQTDYNQKVKAAVKEVFEERQKQKKAKGSSDEDAGK
jgi:hypothetical protein